METQVCIECGAPVDSSGACACALTTTDQDRDTFNAYVCDVAAGRRAGEQVYPR